MSTFSLHDRPITLIDAELKLTIESVKALAPAGTPILLCDSYIQGIEKGGRLSAGLVVDNILNIDHHSPLPEYSRQISSTNEAIRYVREKEPVSTETVVIITHTDCDSVLSSGVMRGILAPNDAYGEAAIAADHTGEANQIGDLLQAFNDKRDIAFSLRNLQLFEEGKPLEPEADALLQKRLEDRERAKETVSRAFRMSSSSKVAYASVGTKIDGGLLPALIPEAAVIVIFSTMTDQDTKQVIPGLFEAKVRLGMAAPDGTDLRTLMRAIDPNWGGRWNAGSNKRGGGTTTDLLTYVAALEETLTRSAA